MQIQASPIGYRTKALPQNSQFRASLGEDFQTPALPCSSRQRLDLHRITHWQPYPKSPAISPGAKWRVVREADSYQG